MNQLFDFGSHYDSNSDSLCGLDDAFCLIAKIHVSLAQKCFENWSRLELETFGYFREFKLQPMKNFAVFN
jgi:hypothetical protein